MSRTSRRTTKPVRPGHEQAVLEQFLAAALWIGAVGTAHASPHDDILDAYIDAWEKLHLLELEDALADLDAAVNRAREAGLGDDPTLASLHAMRAGLMQALDRDAASVFTACLSALRLDPLAEAPIELRSKELAVVCERAKGEARQPSGGIDHRPPQATADADVELVATAGVKVPGDGLLVVYWRRAGSDAYASIEMRRLGNAGRAVVTRAEHGGADIEYFIYAFDGAAQALANVGDRDRPLTLRMHAPVPKVRPAAMTDEAGPNGNPRRQPARLELPRVILSLGVGTGIGVARGNAEQTYEQYVNPGLPGAYTRSQQACATARWASGKADLPTSQPEFTQLLGEVSAAVPQAIPGGLDGVADLAAAYDPGSCGRRHPVDTGIASAPLHIEPEVAVRVYRGLYVSAFARLQVVTGSKVVTDDPEVSHETSFTRDVTATNPPGMRRRPPFTWAIGLKLKYFLGRKPRRLKPFVGVFAGYGNARLRVPLGFANDRNGNSVPDDRELAAVGPPRDDGLIDPSNCLAVWPYNDGCTDVTAADRAAALTATTPAKDQRVDTVAIGPGFAGGLVGLHYQATRHFALTGEVQLGVWFPKSSTVLLDVTFGPAVTF